MTTGGPGVWRHLRAKMLTLGMNPDDDRGEVRARRRP